MRGHALDAVDAQPASPPGRRSVVEAFEGLRRARTRKVSGVGLGEEIHAHADGLSAGALVWEGVVVHLALFVHDGAGGGGHRRWFAPA